MFCRYFISHQTGTEGKPEVKKILSVVFISGFFLGAVTVQLAGSKMIHAESTPQSATASHPPPTCSANKPADAGTDIRKEPPVRQATVTAGKPVLPVKDADDNSLLGAAELATSADSPILKSRIESGRFEGAARELLYAAWARREPENALRHALNSGNFTVRSELVDTLIKIWASRAPDAAEQWVDQNPSAPPSLYAAVFAGICASDPAAAYARWPDFAGKTHAEALMRSLVGGLLPHQSAAETRQWLGGLSTELFEMAVPQVIIYQAKHDPQQAAGLMADFPAALPEACVSEIAGALSRENISEAFRWAESLENSDNRRSALTAVYAQWAGIDPKAAASQFIRQDRGTPDWDAIAAGLAPALARKSPTDALTWLSGIQDNGHRREAFLNAAPVIYQKDPNLLLAWLQDKEKLSPGEWEKIVQP